VSLFPAAEKKTEQVLPIFQAELGKRAMFSWNDPPLERSWTKPDASLVSQIESAQGMLSERFGFCQTLALDEFFTTAESLRLSGYRPVRFRPYDDVQVVRVAAVWTRDGRKWRIAAGLTADQVRRQDERNNQDQFLPVDVAGYVASEKDGKPIDRYAAVWAERNGDDDARLYVGITADLETAVQDRLEADKLIPRTLHAMIGSDGRTRYCGVRGRPPGVGMTAGSPWVITLPGLPQIQTCGFPASGSSSYDFATRPSRLCTTRAFGSSYRLSRCRNSCHVITPSRRRRDSQRFQIFLAPSKNSWRL
jgi:Bacterial tandem repeat domain 1